MGIFDIIELKNHVQAIGEYVSYISAHPEELELCSTMMVDHLKKMNTILDRLDK